MQKTKVKPVNIGGFDFPLPLVLALGLAFVVVKLLLAGAQRVYLTPTESLLDDTLMMNLAKSISQGSWLGEYNYLTLSKHSFFALWLAGLHVLGIPYLLGGQLLWAAAGALAALALMPVLKRRVFGLLLFAFLLFSPSSTANPSPAGYITRVYRDNIFPALCLLVLAGAMGYALRCRERPRRFVGWLVLAGLAAAACRLTREDGWWIVVYLVGALVVAGAYLFGRRGLAPRRVLAGGLALCLPLVLLLGGELAWRGMNLKTYGRFIVSDFSSGEFADAYGALTRIDHEDPETDAPVPKDVRQKLYALSPLFAPFEQYLESEDFYNRYAREDYSAGSFYWALREAAQRLGYYDSPQTAQAFFAALAREVNSLCDSGQLAAGPARSSVNPIIRARHVLPVTGEALYSIWFCATWQQCDARSLRSIGVYETEIRPWEEFLHEKAIMAAVENSDEPYFSLWQRLCYLCLDVVRYIYTVLQPIGFLLALAGLAWKGRRLWKNRKRAGAGQRAEGLPWFLTLGLFLAILLRVFMIAFVTVASFNIGTYVMYLASVHPMMILFSFLGTLQLARLLWERRAGAKEAAHG